MSKIKIETLTSVHVGSGETLQYGNDFVRGKSKDGDDYYIGIVDPQKVMGLIREENIDNWVKAIERKESTSDIVHLYAPKATFEDYSKRILYECSPVKPTDTLKEQIHDGRGLPYIPGSSIKGAIRTAVLSSIIEDEDNLDGEKLITKFKDGQIKRDKKGNPIVKADEYEKTYFGKDPKNMNDDIFRILQIGDAFFEKDCELSIRMVNINEREKQSFWDTSKQQLIEVIGPGYQSGFQMKLNLDLYHIAIEKKAIHSIPPCLRNIHDLFETINNHSTSLIDNEIEYWSERKEKDDTDAVESYIEEMENMKSEAEKCIPGESCILRLGHGSGWRFITGAWAENLDNFDSIVVPASRPNNARYSEYDFPKTRRVSSTNELLGFVKLSIKESD